MTATELKYPWQLAKIARRTPERRGTCSRCYAVGPVVVLRWVSPALSAGPARILAVVSLCGECMREPLESTYAVAQRLEEGTREAAP